MDLGQAIDIIKSFLDVLLTLLNVCILIHQLKDIHNKKHKKASKKPKSKRKGR
ncbi:TPA: hypothetical protein PTV74_003322 [Clostridium botulinum]|nr:hypothetical protein [Clostridium botulinum]HDK7206477.1 hypothetical protein [Clostridium botulinum]HDK7210212.1 hypothetical protein [Clostridium botulinum]HDK7265662.1 hypothetical protein [Clostridium botulinum]HDK7269509.1 hypothetical protein [Clostridium botulinum]